MKEELHKVFSYPTTQYIVALLFISIGIYYLRKYSENKYSEQMKASAFRWDYDELSVGIGFTVTGILLLIYRIIKLLN